MIWRQTIIGLIILTLLAPSGALGGQKGKLSDQEVFCWVASKFGVTPPYKSPQIRWVT